MGRPRKTKTPSRPDNGNGETRRPTTTDFGTMARDDQLNTGTCSSFGFIIQYGFEVWLWTMPSPINRSTCWLVNSDNTLQTKKFFSSQPRIEYTLEFVLSFNLLFISWPCPLTKDRICNQWHVFYIRVKFLFSNHSAGNYLPWLYW